MSQVTFNTKSASKKAVNKDVPFLEGGIHDNLIVKEIIVDKLPTGNYYMRFVYNQLETERIVQHTEFEPGRLPQWSDEQFQDSVDNQINRIMNNHIKPYFAYNEDGTRMTEEQEDAAVPQFDGTSFLGFLKWVKETVEEVSNTVPVRVKVVYGKKGYTSLPNYSKYTSVEPMNTAKSMIVKLSIDNFEPIKVDDESNVTVKPEISEKLTKTSDLPF